MPFLFDPPSRDAGNNHLTFGLCRWLVSSVSGMGMAALVAVALLLIAPAPKAIAEDGKTLAVREETSGVASEAVVDPRRYGDWELVCKPQANAAPPKAESGACRLQQAQAVNEVMAAAMRGHRLLHESCALDRSGDPLRQLEVMRQRLQMSADAVEGLRSALEDYVASLDARQKRRFARLGYGVGEARASARR